MVTTAASLPAAGSAKGPFLSGGGLRCVYRPLRIAAFKLRVGYDASTVGFSRPEAVPSHWTGQPPVPEVTGPHPGGTSQPNSVNNEISRIGEIQSRSMTVVHQAGGMS